MAVSKETTLMMEGGSIERPRQRKSNSIASSTGDLLPCEEEDREVGDGALPEIRIPT